MTFVKWIPVILLLLAFIAAEVLIYKMGGFNQLQADRSASDAAEGRFLKESERIQKETSASIKRIPKQAFQIQGRAPMGIDANALLAEAGPDELWGVR